MTTTTNNLPILIVGAGPSGLTAALSLAQNGVPVRIVDKAPAFHSASRRSGIQPRTVEIFHFLGILDDARRFNTPLPPFQSYKLPGGTEVLKRWTLFDRFVTSPDRPYSHMALSQHTTEGIFHDHLAKLGVRVELGTELVAVEQEDDGVSVTLRVDGDGAAEQIETVRVAYVVGADGARGITRKLICATFEGQTKENDGQVSADVELEGLSSDSWHLWSVPETVLIMARPKLEPHSFHVGVTGRNFNPVDLVDKERFVDFFHKTTGRKDIEFKTITELTYWKPKTRIVNKFQEGRIFIAGDAAHVHPSNGAQGLNTSVQDTFNLAWKLALVHKGLASPDLLRTYEIERLPVIAHMLLATSNLYTHLVPKKGDLDANPEAVLAEGPSKAGFLQSLDSALYQLEINYRWSPIAFDPRGISRLDEEDLKARAYEGYPAGDVGAGDRAPNAPGLVGVDGMEAALFDLFKPTFHTVLVFTPETDVAGTQVAAVVQAAQACPAGTLHTVIVGRNGVPDQTRGALSYHDREGHAYRAYNVDGSGKLTTFVVRPDGYVGAIVLDVDGIQTYFSRIFRSI